MERLQKEFDDSYEGSVSDANKDPRSRQYQGEANQAIEEAIAPGAEGTTRELLSCQFGNLLRSKTRQFTDAEHNRAPAGVLFLGYITSNIASRARAGVERECVELL